MNTFKFYHRLILLLVLSSTLLFQSCKDEDDLQPTNDTQAPNPNTNQ